MSADVQASALSPARLARSSLSSKSKASLRGLSTLLDDRTKASPHTPEKRAPSSLPATYSHETPSIMAPSPTLTPPAESHRGLDSRDSHGEDHDHHSDHLHDHHDHSDHHQQPGASHKPRRQPSVEPMLPARRPPYTHGHVNALLRPSSAPAARKRVERRLAEQHDAKEGGEVRSALLEAGAHLWLAEELRAAADMLSEGAADPRVACERLEELSAALQGEAGRQRWEVGGGTYGGPVALASKAASCMHRASQLRHASRAVEEYATALRHGGARGWVTVFGAGGIAAMHPTLVPTLESLADAETALARAKARPQSRPGAKDHAHRPLSPGGVTGRAAAAGGGGEYGCASGEPSHMSRVATRASAHCRKRLSEAHDGLMRDAGLVADKSSLLTPTPPEHAIVAARVLAGGGTGAGLTSGAAWKGEGDIARRRKSVNAEMWGSTIHPQHGGTWLGVGWRWQEYDGESESEDDFEREEAARQAERARKARQAVRTAHRLYAEFEPDKGVCVRCVERASRLEAQDRGLKGLASREPDGAMERWTGVEDNFYQQRPTFLAR